MNTKTIKPTRRTDQPASLPDPLGDATTPVVSLAPPTKRKPSWVVAGIILVGIAALLGAYVFASINETSKIMVAARDLNPGEQIGPGDLRVVEIGGQAPFRALAPEQQAAIIGTTPRSPIPARTALNTSLFTNPQSVIPDGKVVVGGAFGAGEVPTPTLAVGDRVQLFAVADNAARLNAEGPQSATLLGEGEVWALTGEAIAGGTADLAWASLLIDDQIAVDVVQAIGDDRLRLALVNP